MSEERPREVEYDKKFLKSIARLPRKIQEKAGNKEKVFRINPFDPWLKTHKLHGKEKEHWAFWIDQTYRIKFLFLSGNKILFLDIGTHDEVY